MSFKEERFILAHSVRDFSPWFVQIALGFWRHCTSWRECGTEESHLPHGSQEAKVKQQRAGLQCPLQEHDLWGPNFIVLGHICCQRVQHFSLAPQAGGQLFNT